MLRPGSANALMAISNAPEQLFEEELTVATKICTLDEFLTMSI